MGTLDRIWRVVRANLNSLISQAEDPEKVLEQTVMDMQEDLLQLRQAVAQAIATQKRTERQYSQAQETQEEWYRRAQLAMKKGEEDLAREALTRRKTYLETADAMRSQLEQQDYVVKGLKQNMRQLESKISELKARKDLYVARARSAKATEQLNQVLGNLSHNSTGRAFERMEDRILELEARSQAVSELGSSELDQRFVALESEDEDIEAELDDLRAKLLPPNSSES
ncbi:MAG: PspA/IM30 family protein [Microcoleaceae cyanobacterium]